MRRRRDEVGPVPRRPWGALRWAACVAVASIPSVRTALAAPERPAVFALVIGVNRSVDAELDPLLYADDDAARYFDLFRALGARTYLLATLDDDTRRLHHQAAAEALAPTSASLANVVQQLARDLAQAHLRGVETVLYVTYAGHGNVRGGEGYVSLEDTRLSGHDIDAQIVSPTAADHVHLIVDACYSYFLAFSRGPGGRRRKAEGFTELAGLADNGRVGLLLSTSAARESHEWEALQAGVFSHEVRSGLYGAADANRDGQVSYREIAAFVEQANVAIPNPRFRPRVYARAPAQSDLLVDLRPSMLRRLLVTGQEHAHYFLEDNQGIRLLDFHNGEEDPFELLLPAAAHLYLRRVGDERELEIPAQQDPVVLAALEPTPARSRVRGAAHDSFSLLFREPFDEAVVMSYRPVEPTELVVEWPEPQTALPSWRLRGGILALAGAVGASAAGGVLSWSSATLRKGTPPTTSHVEVIARNHRIELQNQAAVTLYAIAGAAAVGGILLLVWPHNPEVDLGVAADADAGAVTFGLSF